jgi:hypothetical protein
MTMMTDAGADDADESCVNVFVDADSSFIGVLRCR